MWLARPFHSNFPEKMPEKPRFPKVLRRLFRNRPRTLLSTVVSLLPPLLSDAQCRHCEGRRCLACCGVGADAMSFLLRLTDSSDYRKLLNHCFVVVSENAPQLSRFCPDSHWSQHQIVARTIEMIISQQSVSSNVICSGYDKYNQSSPMVEILTRPAWCLLLERVGDEIMAYLLRHTSLFLDIHKKYHQVAGPPISKLCFAMLKRNSMSRTPGSGHIPSGPNQKRKKDDNNVISPLSKRLQLACSYNFRGVSSYCTCVCCDEGRSCLGLARSHHKGRSSRMSLPETANEIKRNVIENSNGDPSQEFQKSSNQNREKLKKRSRPFRWQRHRKRRQLDFQETAVTAPTRILTHKYGLPEKRDLENGASSHHIKNLWQYCCLVRQVPRKVTKGARINRKTLFYNLEISSSVFPRKHVLTCLKPNSSDSVFLLESIFGLSDVVASSNTAPCLQNSGFTLSDTGSVCLYHSLINLLKILIRRTQKCQHLRLLDKHCVVPTLDQNARESSECSFKGNEFECNVKKKSPDCISNCYKNSLEANDLEAIKSYCLKSQVVSFVWAACRSIVPCDLLGTPTNWRILRKNISKFIQLRRFENFSIKQCMHKLKTSAFPFLSKINQVVERGEGQSLGTGGLRELDEATHTIKRRLLESWIYWFFSYVIVPLLQANFYVTESEPGKQDVFYYRKSVWEKVKKRATTNLKDQSYVYLDNAAARDIVKLRRFGFSKLRLLPKKNGVRLIANSKAPSRLPQKQSYSKNEFSRMQKRTWKVKKTVNFHYFKSVNSVLRDTHFVLKGIQLKEPEKLGSSVFDYNDVYKRLCPFLIGLKSRLSKIPGVFIIASDVSKAFDSIDQNKLLSVMNDCIWQEKYTLRQSFQEVLCTKKSLWVRDNLELLDQNINSRTASSISFCSMCSILVNQECSKTLTKTEILFNLNEHIKRNVLQLDKKYYLQGVGISQGSVLSTLLCSLYYGDMERKVIFPFLERTYQPPMQDLSRKRDCPDASSAQISTNKVTSNISYMLLRFVDDFLFISTSKQQAESFFSRLWRGFRDYNCFMNADKFCINFDVGHILELQSNGLCIGEDGFSFIRWSGLLINCCTLEVQADYTKYLNNHLSSSLTVCWQDKPGGHLKAKLCSYLRPKCHPIFYDSNINSPGVVRLNIFQSFLLCAMKFHCYVCDLSYFCKLRTRYYLRIIEKSFRYMLSRIKKRMHSMRLSSNLQPILHLEDGEVEWLGLNAYIQVLEKKQSRHKKLLSLLTSLLLAHDLSQNISSHLTYAVEASHSSLIWKIKYLL